MSETHYAEELKVALEAVQAASRLCLAVGADRNGSGTMTKQDSSPVTVADYGAQALILRRLARAFPGDPVLAEEDAVQLRSSAGEATLELVVDYVGRQVPEATATAVCDWIDLGKTAVREDGSIPDRYWTLDPIDGTKGFLRGEQFAVALALIEEGDVKLGVLGCPALPLVKGVLASGSIGEAETGVLFTAIKGLGAAMGNLEGQGVKPIRVSPCEDPASSAMVESVEAEHAGLDEQAEFAKRMNMTRPSVRLDSQAKYAIVARGESEIYLRLPNRKRPEYRAKIWDHAAGKLLVEEAGGCVTDIHGKPLDFGFGEKLMKNSGMVVTNGRVHGKALEVIDTIW